MCLEMDGVCIAMHVLAPCLKTDGKTRQHVRFVGAADSMGETGGRRNDEGIYISLEPTQASNY